MQSSPPPRSENTLSDDSLGVSVSLTRTPDIGLIILDITTKTGNVQSWLRIERKHKNLEVKIHQPYNPCILFPVSHLNQMFIAAGRKDVQENTEITNAAIPMIARICWANKISNAPFLYYPSLDFMNQQMSFDAPTEDELIRICIEAKPQQ